MQTEKINLSDLYFDPDNLRYDDDFSFNPIPKDRVMNKSNQLKVFNKLKNDISELTDSIIENDFLYIEMIIVHKIDDTNYYVVEGNRRLATLKYIKDNYDINDLKPNLQNIMICGLEVKVNSLTYDEDILMGMRHITGVKHWNGFSKAKLIVKLRDEKIYGFESISKKIGKRVSDVKKQYFSFKLLQNMENDGYSKFEIIKLYTIFYETLGKPSFREWLNWNEEESEFLNKNNLERFYSWITKIENEEGIVFDEAISNPQSLREVSKILTDEYALEILDTTHNVYEAIQNSRILKDKELDKTLKKVLESLKTITVTDLGELSEDSEKYINEIELVVSKNKKYLDFLSQE
jgi:hypothetical protein